MSRALLLALLALSGGVLAPGDAKSQERGARLRPPASVDCPRDHLTVYAGRVVSYRPMKDRLALVVRTDENTRERVVVRHPGQPDAARWYLLDGAAFTAADWPRIEARPGRLRPGTRAAVWACDDGRNPVVDWHPPRAE